MLRCGSFPENFVADILEYFMLEHWPEPAIHPPSMGMPTSNRPPKVPYRGCSCSGRGGGGWVMLERPSGEKRSTPNTPNHSQQASTTATCPIIFDFDSCQGAALQKLKPRRRKQLPIDSVLGFGQITAANLLVHKIIILKNVIFLKHKTQHF